MDKATFEAMAARLEKQSADAPKNYRVEVGALAATGYLLFGAVVLGSIGGLAALAALAVSLVWDLDHPWLVFPGIKLMFLAALPLFFQAKAGLQAVFRRLPEPEGVVLQPSQAPVLFDTLEMMRRRMQGPHVHRGLMVGEMNAAILQRPAFGLFGFPRNHLMLGLPLLEVLPPEEALAVVAHEYGHLAGSHGRFIASIYRLRKSWAAIEMASRQWQGLGGRLLGHLVGWYVPQFNAYSFVLARTNEYQADAAAAALVGPPVVVSALKRIGIEQARFQAWFQQVLELLRERPEPPAEWVRLWPGAPALDAPAHRAWLDAEIGREPGLADTHPGLAARVGALGCMTEELHALPAPRAGASAALAWLGPSLDGLRDRIAQDWSARVGPGWRERHESRRKARAQLAWLRGLPSPTLTERLEVFWLQSELEPRHDTLPEIVAFNTAHPNQVRGLTLEAALRLRKGDASGLPLLDRAMEIDADATPQACELALRHLASRDDPRAQAYAGRWKRHLAKQAKPARGW